MSLFNEENVIAYNFDFLVNGYLRTTENIVFTDHMHEEIFLLISK